MIEPIDLSIAFPVGPEEGKPSTSALAAEEDFNSLLTSQGKGPDEDTDEDKNPIADSAPSIMMGVPLLVSDQNSPLPFGASDPKAMEPPPIPSLLQENDGIQLLFSSLHLNGIAIQEQGGESPLITPLGTPLSTISSSSSEALLASELPIQTLTSSTLLNPTSFSVNTLDANPSKEPSTSYLKTDPLTAWVLMNRGQAAQFQETNILQQEESVTPQDGNINLNTPNSLTPGSTDSPIQKNLANLLFPEEVSPTGPLSEWAATNRGQATQFQETNILQQEEAATLQGGNINLNTPNSLSPGSTDSPIQKVLPHSLLGGAVSAGDQRTLSGHLNPKMETGIPTLSFQGNEGAENPFFDPAGLEKGNIRSSLDGELREGGKILFNESGSVLRSNKEDHPNSEAFTLLNDQKGNSGSNPVMPEGVQKGRETFLSQTESLQVYQQIGKKVVWSLRNNEEKIKLTLDPPDLGNIYMEINREKGNIRATLWTDNPATKEILEAHHIQLYRILKDDGFKLEKFDVFFQQDMGSFQDREEHVFHPGPWVRDEFQEDKVSAPPDVFEINPTLMSRSHRGSKHVDLFV